MRSKLECCASSRETASAVVRLRVPRKSRLILGGRSWHVAPRPRAEGERPLAGAMPLSSARNTTTTSAARRARAPISSAAPSPEKKRAAARVRLVHGRQPDWRWRQLLVRRSTAARRSRDDSRLCSVILWGLSRPQPAWHVAHTQQALVLRLLPRNIERWSACAWFTRVRRLGVGGCSWHVVPRLRADGERLLAGAVPLLSACADHYQRGTARAHNKLACCASS